jgi:hypothetical protein
MNITIKAGVGFMDVTTDTPTSINGVVSLDDLSPYKPIVLMADTSFTVPTAPGTNSRIDIIEVRPNRQATDPQTRVILDTATGAFNPDTVLKTLQNTVDGSVGYTNSPTSGTAAINYKIGVVAATPVEPTVTPGYIKIAAINVGTSVTSIGSLALVDRRAMLFPGNVARCSVRFRLLYNAGIGTQTATIIETVCPPGISWGIDPVISGTLRGQFRAFLVGGQITKFAVTAVNFFSTQLASGESLSANPLPGLSIQDLDSSNQTALALTGISVGVNTKYLEIFAQSTFCVVFRGTTGDASNTDSALEDLYVTLSADVSY